MPQWKTVKLTQQSGMMETDPTTFTFLYIFNESIFRFFRPCIRRIIQLDNQIELGQISLRNRFGIVYLGNAEIHLSTFISQPLQTRIRKSTMLTTSFRQDQHLSSMLLTKQILSHRTTQISLLIITTIVPIHTTQ